MLRSRLQRIVLVGAGAALVLVTALTTGGAPDRATPIDLPPLEAGHDDLSTALRRCAALEGERIEEAGCMAVWEESRHRFFGGQARPHAPAAVPVPSPDASTPPPRASTGEPSR